MHGTLGLFDGGGNAKLFVKEFFFSKCSLADMIPLRRSTDEDFVTDFERPFAFGNEFCKASKNRINFIKILFQCMNAS